MALRVQGEQASSLLEALLAEAGRHDVYLLARLQDLRRKEVVAADGSVEDTRALFSRGYGLHVFDSEGHAAFAAGDGWEPGDALAALSSAIRNLESARRAGADANRAVFDAPRVTDLIDPPVPYGFDFKPLRDLIENALEVHEGVRGVEDGLRIRSLFSVTRDEWRIARSDGTDVSFCIPRSFLSNSLTTTNGDRASAISSVFANSHELLLDEEQIQRSLRKAAHTAKILRRTAAAGPFPGGSLPMVMDHSLAKVLAHEAFGHAAESDAYRSSVLARNGRFRKGEDVASRGVNLIDESIPGDHAFQPYSANGLPRERATILADGRLNMGLADLFSAEEGGVPVTGAGRAESYRDIPYPRMSNIRIELDDPAPLDIDIDEEITPEQARSVLIREGFLNGQRPRVMFLNAFRGGQVNPARGDFVFNSQALFELSLDGVKDYRPAIFSGSVMGALKAIRGALGDLRLDAMGTCGKRGQGVPSCGGSHRLLFLEANESIKLGGGQ